MKDLAIYLCKNSSSELDSDQRIRYLLEIGVDANSCTSGGRSLLQIICWKYGQDDVINYLQLLIDFGADVNHQDKYGYNALHFACRFNCTEQLPAVVKLLLKTGINVNAKSKNGWTALHDLCKYNSTKDLHQVVKMLLGAGIDINSRNSGGYSALHLLCRFNRYCVDSFSSVFELFVLSGALVDTITDSKQTLLHTLCHYGAELRVYDLITNYLMDIVDGCVEAEDCFGTTAVIYAARIGCVRTVLLLAQKAQNTAVDGFGKSAIDYLLKFSRLQSHPSCKCCGSLLDLSGDLLFITAGEMRIKSAFPPVNLGSLEKSIPRYIDTVFSNSQRDDHISVADEIAWAEVVDKWHSSPAFDFNLYMDFIEKNTHTLCGTRCRWCRVSNVVQHYVRLLTEKAAEVDERFRGVVIQYGSSAEKSKLFSPDEFDFMIVLDDFQQTFSRAVTYVGDGRADHFHDSANLISSSRLLYYYYRLLHSISCRIDYFHILQHDISYGETCVTLQLLCRLQDEHILKVSVDITVGVKEQHSQCYLVPHRKVNDGESSQWKISYPINEREILKNAGSEVVRCYALVKLLALVSHVKPGQNFVPRKTGLSSYAIKTCLFRYLELHPGPWLNCDLSDHCIGICEVLLSSGTKLNSFFDHSVAICQVNHKSRQIMKNIRDRLKDSKDGSQEIPHLFSNLLKACKNFFFQGRR